MNAHCVASDRVGKIEIGNFNRKISFPSEEVPRMCLYLRDAVHRLNSLTH